jgi:hypothetical protein
MLFSFMHWCVMHRQIEVHQKIMPHSDALFPASLPVCPSACRPAMLPPTLVCLSAFRACNPMSTRMMICLPQSFEHLPLPQQRLSLYAMGSGMMLDMLADGLDLDTFLGPSDLAAGPADGLHGTGADTIAPVAPGSRVSIRWLRASCSM